MSLRERRGNMLSVPTKVKRTESYFALPVSLRNNTEAALGQILTIGKGALNSLSSKFWEFINPAVEPNLQMYRAQNNVESGKVDERAENLPLKRKNEDSFPVCDKKRAVQRESVEVQTDPYVVMKIPGRINLGRNQDNVVKGLDLFGDMETKGTDDDEEDLGKGKKRIRRVRRQKIWIQRGPSLEVIPEKSNEGGKDKKLPVFPGLEKKENYGFNPAAFTSPKKMNQTVETVKTGGLFSWSTDQTSKSLFGPQDPAKSSFDLTASGQKVVESSLFNTATFAGAQKMDQTVETVKTGGLAGWPGEQAPKSLFGPQDPTKSLFDLPASVPKLGESSLFNPGTFASAQKMNQTVEILKTGGLFGKPAEQASKSLFGPQDPPKTLFDTPIGGPKAVESSLFKQAPDTLFTNFSQISPIVPSHEKPTLTPLSQFPDTKTVKNTLINPTETNSSSTLKPFEIQAPTTNPPEPAIKPTSNQTLTTNSQPKPVEKPNPQIANPAPPLFTQPVELKTVIENAQSNPFLNKSIVSSNQTSYKFGEVKSEPTPVVFTQMPQIKSTTDIEMDSFITCESKVPENNFQSFGYAPMGFQTSFTPISILPTSAPMVGTGIFGGSLPYNTQNTVPQPKSTGFNLGIISNQNQKRGRK